MSNYSVLCSIEAALLNRQRVTLTEEKTMDTQGLADIVRAQSRTRLARDYSQRQADELIVEVIPGPKYTKINRGTKPYQMSGYLMVENATGEIYGIKGYGQVHKGRHYGSLDTVASYNWGSYHPVELTT